MTFQCKFSYHSSIKAACVLSPTVTLKDHLSFISVLITKNIFTTSQNLKDKAFTPCPTNPQLWSHKPDNPFRLWQAQSGMVFFSTFLSCCQTNRSIIHCHCNSDSKVIRYCNDGLVWASEKMKPSAYHFPEGLKWTLFSFPVFQRLINFSLYLNFPKEFCQNGRILKECNWCLYQKSHSHESLIGSITPVILWL